MSPHTANSSAPVVLGTPLSWAPSRLPALFGWGRISVPEKAREVYCRAVTLPAASMAVGAAEVVHHQVRTLHPPFSQQPTEKPSITGHAVIKIRRLIG